MTDQNNTDDEKGHVDEVIEGAVLSKNMSKMESLRQSLSGWREIGGMTLARALAIDLVFVAIGVAWYSQTMAPMQYIGLLIAGVGGFGVVEKLVRRA